MLHFIAPFHGPTSAGKDKRDKRKRKEKARLVPYHADRWHHAMASQRVARRRVGPDVHQVILVSTQLGCTDQYNVKISRSLEYSEQMCWPLARPRRLVSCLTISTMSETASLKPMSWARRGGNGDASLHAPINQSVGRLRNKHRNNTNRLSVKSSFSYLTQLYCAVGT